MLEYIGATTVTLHENAATTGNGTIVDTGGRFATAVVQITGTMGVVTFKGTIDGKTWVNLACTSLTTGATTATAAAIGIYSVPVPGLLRFKAEITTHTGGDARISAIGNFLPVVSVVNATD